MLFGGSLKGWTPASGVLKNLNPVFFFPGRRTPHTFWTPCQLPCGVFLGSFLPESQSRHLLSPNWWTLTLPLRAGRLHLDCALPLLRTIAGIPPSTIYRRVVLHVVYVSWPVIFQSLLLFSAQKNFLGWGAFTSRLKQEELAGFLGLSVTVESLANVRIRFLRQPPLCPSRILPPWHLSLFALIAS